jgi:hypothetical protein
MKIQAMMFLTGALTLCGGLPGAMAQVAPIAVTGWTHDLVLNNPAPYNQTVTGTMDGGLGITIEGWTWVAAGEYTNVDGNPQQFLGLTPGTHSSLTGRGTFAFQPFDALNAVGLDSVNPTATLTLTTPAAYKSIALYGASSYGAKSIDVTLHFADSTWTTIILDSGTGVGSDWFDVNADRALNVGGRASNKSEEEYTRLFYQESADIGISETYIELSAADQAKELTGIEFYTFAGDRTAILAVSGAPVSALQSADFNSNGFVEGADLTLWKTGYGKSSGATRVDGDATGDGVVDGADFLTWQRQYTGPAAAIAAVPEPATASLCLVAALGVATASRWRK